MAGHEHSNLDSDHARLDIRALRAQFEANGGQSSKTQEAQAGASLVSARGSYRAARTIDPHVLTARLANHARSGSEPLAATRDPPLDQADKANRRRTPPTLAPKPVSAQRQPLPSPSIQVSESSNAALPQTSSRPPTVNLSTRPSLTAKPEPGSGVHNTDARASVGNTVPPLIDFDDHETASKASDGHQNPDTDPFANTEEAHLLKDIDRLMVTEARTISAPGVPPRPRSPRQSSTGPPIPQRPLTPVKIAKSKSFDNDLSLQERPRGTKEAEVQAQVRPPLPQRSSEIRPKEGEVRPSNKMPPQTAKNSPGRNGPLPPPPQRVAAARQEIIPVRPRSSTKTSFDSDPEDEVVDKRIDINSGMPNVTLANRQKPVLPHDVSIHHGQSLSSFCFGAQHIVTAHQHTKIWYLGVTTTPRAVPALPEHRVSAMGFRATSGLDPSDHSRFVWLGLKDGSLCELDTLSGIVVQRRFNVHAAGIDCIFHHGNSMLTIDETGKTLSWTAEPSEELSMLSKPRPNRLQEKPTFAMLVGDELWVANAYQAAGRTLATLRAPNLKIYKPFTDQDWQVTRSALTIDRSICPTHFGNIISGTTIQSQPELVFFGHDDGLLSVWSTADRSCIKVMRLGHFALTCMTSVTSLIWVGLRNGMIYIFDPETDPWTVRKMWKAHTETVIGIMVDEELVKRSGQLLVASGGAGGSVHVWDGLLMEDWYLKQLQDRETDYCDYRDLSVAICTWNINAALPSQLTGTVANHECFSTFLSSVDSPDIIVFGFQEVIDLENKALTAKSLLMGKKRGADARSSNSTVSANYALWVSRIISAVRSYLPEDYTVTHKEDLVGLLSVVLVKTSEWGNLNRIAVKTIKTGMGGLYGNKGSILSRLTIDDTSICFLNSHLAAGQSSTRQRNKDVADILGDIPLFPEAKTLTRDSPCAFIGGGDGAMVFDHEICFFSGDLNYRIDQARSTVLQRASLGPQGWQALQESDQLLRQIKNNPDFRLSFFKEPPIAFAPTYKYNPGSDDYDSSEKLRIPAYCDRILYKGGPDRVQPLLYSRLEANISDHRPVIGGYRIRIKKSDTPRKAKIVAELEKTWPRIKEAQLKQNYD